MSLPQNLSENTAFTDALAELETALENDPSRDDISFALACVAGALEEALKKSISTRLLARDAGLGEDVEALIAEMELALEDSGSAPEDEEAIVETCQDLGYQLIQLIRERIEQ